MRNYRIIRKKRTDKQLKFLRKCADDVAIKYGKKPMVVVEYDYGLSEVYYNKGRKTPHGRSEPDSRHEDIKDVVRDLQMMLKDAKRSLKEGLIFDVSDNDKPKKIRKMA